MEKPVCFLEVNDNDIPIFDLDDPVWHNPENYFPVEFLSIAQRPISVPEDRQDEAGSEAVRRSPEECATENVQKSVETFQLSDFIVPVDSTIQESKTPPAPTVDIGKISFIVFPSPTGIMVTIKGVRYMERLCLDVLEFLNVFKFLFSEQCIGMKDGGLIYGSEKDRKRVLDLSKPGMVIFGPTLHTHWIKLYGTLHLRMVISLKAPVAASCKCGVAASKALRAWGAAAEITGLTKLASFANRDFNICGSPEPF